MTPVFDGQRKNGRTIIHDKVAFGIWMDSLEGNQIEIIVRRAVKRRSNQQNRWMWGIAYKIISQELGWDIDDVHEFAKLKFNPVARQIVDKDSGEITEITIGGSTAKMTTVRFSEYKEAIQAFFAEYNIHIPDPGQVDAEEFDRR